MGTVLEMTGAGSRAALGARWPALALIAALLTGCGAVGSGGEGLTQEEVVSSAVSGIQRLFPSSGGELGGARPEGQGFTPEAIAAQPTAFRLVQINALGIAEPARVIRANGDEVTLELQSGPTAAYDGGVLVSTRGFGDDLLTVESRGVLGALRAGGGNVERIMETLDAQDQVRRALFFCTIAPAGSEAVNLGLREVTLRRFDENCRSETLIFDNIYWLDSSGSIVASRQYVSPTVAYLRSNRL